MNSPELAIIMPVYNEQASVRKVVTEWFHEIEKPRRRGDKLRKHLKWINGSPGLILFLVSSF